PSSGEALPRTVRVGVSRSQNQRRSPLAESKAVTRPSMERTSTYPCPTVGAARISVPTFAVHFCAPLAASRATTSPSRLPTTTRPSPTPGPLDRRSSDSTRHAGLPLCRSHAPTPPLRSAAKTRPSTTAGAWREPSRPSPLPTLTDHIRCGLTVGVNSTSSAGSATALLLSLNQPLTVLQPPSATTQASRRKYFGAAWAPVLACAISFRPPSPPRRHRRRKA